MCEVPCREKYKLRNNWDKSVSFYYNNSIEKRKGQNDKRKKKIEKGREKKTLFFKTWTGFNSTVKLFYKEILCTLAYVHAIFLIVCNYSGQLVQISYDCEKLRYGCAVP
jgi:hypothetical protein